MDRITDLERKYVLEALDNGFRSSLNNVFNAKLEKAFAELVGCRYAIGFVNGTATLHTALAACGVGPGDEVVVPPLTMSSPALSVLQNGSVPVFADVDRGTFTMDPAAAAKVVNGKTRALMPVALYGIAPDYDGLAALAKPRGLRLVEDNAECVLGTYKGRMAGTFGDFASFSFQASKHLTVGEGGMLTTDDEALADKARKFSCLGYASVSSKKGKISRDDIQHPDYNRHVSLGFNFRMSEINAAVALGQVERARELVDVRIRAGRLFREASRDFRSFVPQADHPDLVNSYWTFAGYLATDRPAVDWPAFRELFRSNGGDPYYAAWKLSYFEDYFQRDVRKAPGTWQGYEPGLCPNAEYLQPRMIQLKTNYWKDGDAERQADVLHRTLRDWEAR